MTPTRDTNGWARWDYLDLIRAALAGSFRPEDYLAAACVTGKLTGLPIADNLFRAAGISVPFAGRSSVSARLMQDASYLRVWSDRAGVESWSAGDMLIAAIAPARLPWRGSSVHTIISKERWSEAYAGRESWDRDRDGYINVGDLAARADFPSISRAVALKGLQAARCTKLPGGERSLMKFQTDRALPVTGAWDAATDRALFL